MSIVALGHQRTSLLLIAAAADEAGLNCRLVQADATQFLAHIQTTIIRYALLTEAYLNEPSLFSTVKQGNTPPISLVCVTSEAKVNHAFWHALERLDFDVLCRLDELSACLLALSSGRYFVSELLRQRRGSGVNVPGLDELTRA